MVSLLALYSNCPLEGGWWAFKENPYNAQSMPRHPTDRGSGALSSLLIEVAGSYKQLTLGPLFL